MKRTPLKTKTPLRAKRYIRRVGKRGRANLSANAILNRLYAESSIRDCELKLEGCDGWPLNYCHRHERDYYKGDVEKLASFNQTVIGCQKCHRKIDDNKQLREEKFFELRGPEE